MKGVFFVALAIMAGACVPLLAPTPGPVNSGGCDPAASKLAELGCPIASTFASACKRQAQNGLSIDTGCLIRATSCTEASRCK